VKVLVRERISEAGLELLRAKFEVDVDADGDLADKIADYDAIIIRSGTQLTEDLIGRAERLKVIGRAGVGVDNVDLEAASRRGIVVANAPQSTVVSAAEHTIGLLLALSRSIPQAHAALKQGSWDRSRFGGLELAGKTLGLAGFGRIGQQVARRARGLEMNVMAYDPYVAPGRFQELGVDRAESLEDLLAASDFLSLPLLEALRSGKVAGAALDVFSAEPYTGPLLELENVVVTPHLAASTEEAQDRAGVIVAEQVAAALEGGLVTNAVNMPAVVAEEAAFLAPFAPLAAKLGALAVELAAEAPSRLELTYLGELAERDTRFLTVAALDGVFQGRVDQAVNYVNAPLLAQERGIEVREERRRASRDFTSLITVAAVTGKESTAVSGTTMGHDNEPRLVRALGYEIEIGLEPRMLFVVNDDRPGMIGRLGTLLGEAGLNIAHMTVSRNRRSAKALMAITLDSAPDDDLLERLRGEPGFVEVRFITLEDA
jgi:D-3-phosphoglycerate dehydrogenase